MRPDGRMLFSYRTTKDEYVALRDLLSVALAELQGAPWILHTPNECACFVLYAAEWWRREYVGDLWRWTAILDSIGPAYRLDVLERTAAVEMGLRAWGHRPSGQGKKYLGAIVAQGGLPLRLVARGDGAVTYLLKRGMRQAQLYGWDGQRLEAYFEAYSQNLVQHLRDEEIYRLLASMVTTVLSLRQDHKLAGASNPVEVLERDRPDWRNLFPIAVDEDRDAAALLLDLVHEAAREVARGAAYPVTATRTLQATGEHANFQLLTTVAMPHSVLLEALSSAVGVAPDKVPQAFSIDLIGVERTPLAEARQLLGDGEQMVTLSGKSRMLKSENSIRELRFAIRSKGTDLHTPTAIPGGDELDEAQPWVFVERDGAWVLVGVGACRVAEDKARVALPTQAQLRGLDSDAAVTPIGELATASLLRTLYEVSGQVEAEIDEAVFKVRTQQTAYLSEQLIWRGQREPYQSDPFPVYRGVPRLYRLGDDGTPVAVPERQVVWTTANRAAISVALPRAHVGPIDAWLTADGAHVRRFRMVLLPEMATLKFCSGSDDRSGAIELKGWSVENVDVSTAVSASLVRTEGTVKVELSTVERPPTFVSLRLSWTCSPHPLRITLPFPATGARFTLSTGEELSRGDSVSVARMEGVLVQVLDRNPNLPQKYKLVAELSGSGPRLRIEQPIAVGNDGSGELRLLDIKAVLQGLLCQSDELDAKLSLRVETGVKSLAEVNVIRYDVDLQRHELQAALTTAHIQRLSAEQLQAVKLCALPLLRAEFVEQELAQASSDDVPVGRWDLAGLGAKGGPWLVVPTHDSGLVVRPMFYAGTESVAADQLVVSPCPLGQAMAIGALEDRIKALDSVVAVMAEDYDHVSWKLVERHYAVLNHLPLSTLDYWRAFARLPAACLAVLLKLSHDMPKLAGRMRDELGVVWELVPGAALRNAFSCLHQSWARQLGPEQNTTVNVVVGRIFQDLAAAEVCLVDWVELTLFQAGTERTELLMQLLGEVQAGARQLAERLWAGQDSLLQRYLLRTHVDDEYWPEFDLADALIKKLHLRAPQALSQLINVLGDDPRKLFWVPTQGQTGPYAKNVKQDAANVPLLCGLLSQLAEDARPWWTPTEIDQIRQLRAFAPAWFEVACRVGSLMALSTRQQTVVRPATYIAHESGISRV